MYSEMLNLEVEELSKKSAVNWERVLVIRHLKDRMIRKCQRLSPSLSFKREIFTFQTIVAPADFRLKEMEKWLREDQARSKPKAAVKKSSISSLKHKKSSSCCHRCLADNSDHFHPRRPAQSRAVRQDVKMGDKHIPVPASKAAYTEDDFDLSTLPSTASSDRAPSPEDKASYFSLLRPSNARNSVTVDIPPDEAKEPDAEKSERPLSGTEDITLRRRRSCIKRSSSDAVKTVSWATQLSKHTIAAQEAQESGKFLSRSIFHCDKSTCSSQETNGTKCSVFIRTRCLSLTFSSIK